MQKSHGLSEFTMSSTPFTTCLGLILGLGLLGSLPVQAADEVNIYSARHYQTDQALYDNFTQSTGIKINRIEAKSDVLIERIKQEGLNSPADIFISVDAGRMWRAEQAGILDSIQSDILDRRLPDHLRHSDGTWFGLSLRARGLVYNTKTVPAADVPKTYAELTDSKWKNRICIRSSGNIYNISLLASMIEREGAAKSKEWARGIVTNMARKPQGGDTDQIRAVAAGACDVTVVNGYYYARLMASDKQEDKAVVATTRFVFPDQDTQGTHINISGGAVVKGAPNKENAIRFLEYLTSKTAQTYFAAANNEYPAVRGSQQTPVLDELGPFKADTLDVSALGKNQTQAIMIFDTVGWQ